MTNEQCRLTWVGPTYVVAVYEMDRAYGGPEEGGWWFDVGDLMRVVKVFKTEDRAYEYARRMNEKFASRERFYGWPSSSSVAYAGGEYRARVYANYPPEHFPDDRRPHYE